MLKFLLIFLSFILFFIEYSCSNNYKAYLKNGDIIFQTSISPQSKVIQIATKMKYSHMGIIYIENKKYYVLEAVQPVKLTRLEEWIKRGKNGHFVVKRLIKADLLLNVEIISKMKKIGEQYIGKDYDPYFEWSDERMYCSELIWKLYNQALNLEIGNLQKFKDFDLSHSVVKDKIKDRYGNKFPLDEPVISPAQMFNSELLEFVYSN